MNKSYLHSPVVSLSPVSVIKCSNCFLVTEPVLFLSNAKKAARTSCSVLMFLPCCSAIILKNSGKRTFCFPETEKGMLLKSFKGSAAVPIITCTSQTLKFRNKVIIKYYRLKKKSVACHTNLIYYLQLFLNILHIHVKI